MRRQQQPRRQAVEKDANALDDRQHQARQKFSARQKQERMAFRQGYLQESRRIKLDRATHRPTGLAAFIGRITGVELITKKIHQYRDATRYKLFLAQKKELADRQQREAATFERRQELERAKIRWRLRALDQLEKRELRSLETKLLKDRRIEDRERTDRAPSPPEPTPEVTPEKQIDVMAEFEKASAQPEPSHVDEFNRAAKKPIDLMAEFERASGSGDGDGKASGGVAQNPAPEAEIKIERRRRRTRDRAPDEERSTQKTRDRDKDNDGPPSDDPGSTRGRRRDRDLDRGR